MEFPEDCKYTEEHEWVRMEGEEAVVGITDYAQQALGDIVFVDLPKVGAAIKQMEPFGMIEAVKAASDLLAPLSGEVAAVNESLADDPAPIHKSPYGDGWMLRVKPSDPGELDKLMSAADYAKTVEGLEGGA